MHKIMITPLDLPLLKNLLNKQVSKLNTGFINPSCLLLFITCTCFFLGELKRLKHFTEDLSFVKINPRLCIVDFYPTFIPIPNLKSDFTWLPIALNVTVIGIWDSSNFFSITAANVQLESTWPAKVNKKIIIT